MKKHLLIASLIAMPTLAFSQIFQENWDGDGPGITAWTLIDADGKTPAANISALFPNAWNVITPTEWTNLTSNVASSTSWYTPAGAANDWLVSPSITITGDNATLAWKAFAQDPNYRDGYKVMIAPNGGNTIDDFTTELFSIDQEVGSTPTERSVDLSNYIGTTIRFAFVNQSNDMFAIAVDDIRVVNDYVAPVAAACVTLLTPTAGETNVSVEDNLFTWNASPASEGVTGYNFYLGTDPNALQLLGNTPETSVNITGLVNTTTYYWVVKPMNAGGEPENCTVNSFTTEASIFAPYCGPLKFQSEFLGMTFDGTEAISNVNFAGINNASDPLAEEANHENFISIVGEVKQSTSYDIKIQGNTAGDFTSKFAVFIDWNQNGVLNDAGEVYEVTETLTNSDGADGQEVTHSIAVPADALVGETRMRVKKIYDDEDMDAAALLDPCAGASYGQAEDYTLNVGLLSVNDINKAKIVAYPNPVVDVLKVNTGSNAKSIEIYDLTGKLLSTQAAKSTNNEVNMSRLKTGTYIVKINTDNGSETVKVIKN